MVLRRGDNVVLWEGQCDDCSTKASSNCNLLMHMQGMHRGAMLLVACDCRVETIVLCPVLVFSALGRDHVATVVVPREMSSKLTPSGL